MIGQNPHLKCCQPLKILTHFERCLDIQVLKYFGLLVKGLQSYQLSNFENDSTPSQLEPGPIAIAHNLGGMAEAADFLLRTPKLTASNFAVL